MRTRVLAVPLVVAGLPTAFLVSLSVSDALEARAERRADREYERRVAPAVEALHGIRLAGLTPCPDRNAGEEVCLTGDVAVRPTSTALDAALRAAGATDVVSSCRKPAARDFCTVRARLHGSDVFGGVGHVRADGTTGEPRVTLMVVPAAP
ncbi:MAG TPA: hypothetical protein VF519_08300 [Mycobacteriales bacterium]|jgi:hypothetical protein